MGANDRPAERIVLSDLLLRRLSMSDAASRVTAVAASLEHLRPWMPWAAVRPTISAEEEYLDAMTRQWESGETFGYAILDPAEGKVLGSIALHGRVGPGGWDIGYWVHAGHVGRGIATTSAAVLTGVGLSLTGTQRVEIHCDEANAASAVVPRRLGYRLDRIEEREPAAPGESGRRMIWTMTQDAYTGSAAYRRATAAQTSR